MILSVVPVRSSMKLVMSSALAVLALLIRSVMTEGWPAGMFSVPKLFVTPIGVLTVRAWLNAGLVRPRVLPIAPALTRFVNTWDVGTSAGTTTFTVSVHVPLRPIVPPASVTDVSFGAGAGDSTPFDEARPRAARRGARRVRHHHPGRERVREAGQRDRRAGVRVRERDRERDGVARDAGRGAKALLPVGLLSVLTDRVALAGVVLKTSTPLSFAV